MFRTSALCLTLLALTVPVAACGSDQTSADKATTTVAASGAPARTGAPASTSGAAPSNSGADACTEVQYEIDLAHQLQQGQEPSDPQAAIARLAAFRKTAPTEIIANQAQVAAVIVGHLQHRGQDHINGDDTNAILDKLVQWKNSHC